MNFRSILIVTYGRTGSTLLQGLLNVVPGVKVRGENHNFAFDLYKSFLALDKTIEEQGVCGGDPTMPFFGSFLLDRGRFFSDTRRLIRRQLVPEEDEHVHCWGFKEIRYLPANLQVSGSYQLSGYLEFLEKVMPKPAFVFLTRDHDDVASSGFWANADSGRVKEQFALFENEAHCWSESRRNCFWVDYRDLVEESATLSGLFDFLGVEPDPVKVKKVLGRKHSIKAKADTLQLAKNWSINLEDNEHVAEFSVDDNLPLRLSEGATFSLGGVVVLVDGPGPDLVMFARDGRGERRVVWDLPSPKYGAKYPANRQAANARFRLDDVLITGTSSVHLELEDGTGQRTRLCTISLKSEEK